MPYLQLTYYGAGADSGSYCKGNAGLQVFGTNTIAVCTALLPANCGAQACVMGTGSGLGGTPPSTSPVTYSELITLWAVFTGGCCCPVSVLPWGRFHFLAMHRTALCSVNSSSKHMWAAWLAAALILLLSQSHGFQCHPS